MELIELVRQAQTGDTDAQGALYEKTYKKVYYLALRLTGNPEDAQDATQDAFISAFKAVPNLREPNAFEGWLFQIVANKCRNRIARGHNDEELPEGFEEHEPDPQEDLIPEDALQSAEKRRLILQIIDDLPDLQRECVMLFYYSEMSVKQIAETLECSEGTVKSRLNYARQKLKDGILETEKRDNIRLHTFIPFGLFLAKDFVLSMAGVTTAATGGTAAVAASTGSAAAGSSTAGTAAGTVKAGLLATAKAKVIAGVTAAAIVVGGGAAVVSQMPKAIAFSDPAMEHNIRVLVDKPSGSIYDRDFQGHHAITVYEDGIAFAGKGESQDTALPDTVPVTSLADLAQMPSITGLYYESMEEEPIHTLGQNPYLTSVHISRPCGSEEPQLFVEDTSFLKELPNLEKLHLNVNSHSGGSSIGYCANLRSLSLNVSDTVRLDLPELKQLESLSLYGPGSTIRVRSDEELPALHVFNWHGASGELADLLLLMPNLQVANLFTDGDAEEALEALGQLEALRAVKIVSSTNEDLDLQPLSACPKLELCTTYDTENYFNPPPGVRLDIIQRPNESEQFEEIYRSALEKNK